MTKQNKTILILCQMLVMIFLLGMQVNATDAKPKTLADVPNTCWTKEQCDGQKGIFKIGEGCEKYSGLGKCYKTLQGSTLKVAIPNKIEKDKTANISQYIEAIYQFTITLAALLAVIMIMIAGVRWMTAMGNQGQLDSAKTMMMNSIIGLVLALGSYFILYSINPALVQNEMTQVAMIRTEALKEQQCKFDEGVILTAKSTVDLKEGTLCKQKCTGEITYGQSTQTFSTVKTWDWNIIDYSKKEGLCKCCITELTSCPAGTIEISQSQKCKEYCEYGGLERGTLINGKHCCECSIPFEGVEKENKSECKEFCKKSGKEYWYDNKTKSCQCLTITVP